MLREVRDGSIDDDHGRYLCLKCAKTYDNIIDMLLLDQDNEGICEKCKHDMLFKEYHRIKEKFRESKRQATLTAESNTQENPTC